MYSLFFFFNATATPEIYPYCHTLSLHDALPISTFKIFTMAMALDAGVASMRDSYDATKPIRIAHYTIRDFHAKKRWLSVPEIFMYSSNIGAAKMEIGRARV